MTEEKTYCDIAWELLDDAREIDWTIWNTEADELTRNVADVMSCVFHLSCTASALLDLRRMREGGHEMCFEDYAMDRRLLGHLEMLKGKVRRMQSVIEDYAESLVDATPQDDEMWLGKILNPCGEDETIRKVGHFAREFCLARRDMFMALLPLFKHYRKIMVEAMRLFYGETADFVSLWKKEYEEWLLQYRPSIERKLKNGLYKSSLYGKTILPLLSMIPSRENWGEALGLKMQQIREDDIYKFIDNDEFHEVGLPIELTERLLTETLNSITLSMHTAELEELSYDRQMKTFYRHIAEINILKEKIALPTVPVRNNQQREDNNYLMESEENDELSAYPAMALLERLVRIAIKEKKKPKYILMPVRAAREAGVSIPITDVKSMNGHFGTELTRQNWSQWVNGTAKSGYDPKELNPMKSQFLKLA